HTGLFPDSEFSVIGKGCIGLCELRSGSYLNSIGQTDPLNRKVKVFTTLEEAQRYQRWAAEENTVEIGGKKMWAKKDTVLFAVQSKGDFLKGAVFANWVLKRPGSKGEFRGKVVDIYKAEFFSRLRGEEYNYATAFQNQVGDILFLEWMPHGASRPGAVV